MTVALGVLAQNSLILAADTQITTETEKFSQGKIHIQYSTPGSAEASGVIAITGAGDAFLLRAAQSDIADLFSKTPTNSMDELEAAIAKFLKTFYKEYVALTPDMGQRPEIDLIIAARRGESSGMWVTTRNRIKPVQSNVAVGSGGAYATSLLERFSLPQSPETAMLLAAYIVFLVKNRSNWVGMDTLVLRLDDSDLRLQPKGFSPLACRRLEELFRSCMSMEARVLHRMLGSEYVFCDREHLHKDLETMRKHFLDIVRQPGTPAPAPVPTHTPET